jgi:hypothetical protein
VERDRRLEGGVLVGEPGGELCVEVRDDRLCGELYVDESIGRAAISASTTGEAREGRYRHVSEQVSQLLTCWI